MLTVGNLCCTVVVLSINKCYVMLCYVMLCYNQTWAFTTDRIWGAHWSVTQSACVNYNAPLHVLLTSHLFRNVPWQSRWWSQIKLRLTFAMAIFLVPKNQITDYG